MSYVNFDAPKKLKKKAADLLTKVVEAGGKIRKGMNETTKSIERQKAVFVAIAEDVDPPEIVYHLPLICDEKDVPYIFIETRETLGKAVKLDVPTAAV
ncbi:MAG: 50S ribosomal protein L7ae, partial [Candidatus Lokiarchaeota archaeon]|nr:50S ribosomal protein L7ae [Candidatus Lokiarchaeota archaeon]